MTVSKSDKLFRRFFMGKYLLGGLIFLAAAVKCIWYGGFVPAAIFVVFSVPYFFMMHVVRSNWERWSALPPRKH